ncbi:MAG: sulfatase-like hydrolase/transferase [Bacteroidota bacterium]|nr:sulfatase-like hydrolase/transferase [Bacteroidota bacterium]MDX5431150.1 sulfatase-like hydrolase/transferase [Bacteroidota bacterium]MDX5469897.1 sulfatase-like hydrolase/transferase [Bacteroidota bacterium]
MGTPNILLIIADDLGKDALAGYTEGNLKPNTPNLDALRNKGLMFTNFWSYPTCTPTRASIITGKYGYHSNMLKVGDVLSPSELCLQKYLKTQGGNTYATAIVGKWHLSGNDSLVNPEDFGIDYYTGLIRGEADNYFRWQLTEDGQTSLQTNYITEEFTTRSIDWIKQQDKPWFLWLAYTAPHTPFHVPPSEMHSQGNLLDYQTGMNAMKYYLAAIEAMDFQIGRLLKDIPAEDRDNTIIIFIGDNGSPNQVAQSPYTGSRVKGTLYQGGINVPMIVSGKGISRTGTEPALLNSTDLFATIAEMAGLNLPSYEDSRSFVSLFSQSQTIRDYTFSEMKEGSDSWAISNGEYKLIQLSAGTMEMYDLGADPYEQINLLNGTLTPAQVAIKQELQDEVLNIRK